MGWATIFASQKTTSTSGMASFSRCTPSCVTLSIWVVFVFHVAEHEDVLAPTDCSSSRKIRDKVQYLSTSVRTAATTCIAIPPSKMQEIAIAAPAPKNAAIAKITPHTVRVVNNIRRLNCVVKPIGRAMPSSTSILAEELLKSS
jgi:hypothetical protein